MNAKKAKFQVYCGVDRMWYWRLDAKNGEIIASGEGFTTKASATRAVQAVKRAVISITSAETKKAVVQLASFTVKRAGDSLLHRDEPIPRMVKGRDRR